MLNCVQEVVGFWGEEWSGWTTCMNNIIFMNYQDIIFVLYIHLHTSLFISCAQTSKNLIFNSSHHIKHERYYSTKFHSTLVVFCVWEFRSVQSHDAANRNDDWVPPWVNYGNVEIVPRRFASGIVWVVKQNKKNGIWAMLGKRNISSHQKYMRNETVKSTFFSQAEGEL